MKPGDDLYFIDISWAHQTTYRNQIFSIWGQQQICIFSIKIKTTLFVRYFLTTLCVGVLPNRFLDLWEKQNTVEKTICKKVQRQTIRKIMVVVGGGGGGGEVRGFPEATENKMRIIHTRYITLTEIFSTGLRKFIQETFNEKKFLRFD